MQNQAEIRDAYIALLERAVTNQLYEESTRAPSETELEAAATALGRARRHFEMELGDAIPEGSFLQLSPAGYHRFLASMSARRPVHTMTAPAGVANVVDCVRRALEAGVPGDFMETGVWKGGLTILMRGILKAYGERRRAVWVADSFAGVPVPRADQLEDRIAHYLAGPLDFLAIDQSEVERNFERYGLLDEQVRFLPGLFQDTLPRAPIESIAVLRLDGDLYESTRCCLEHLYPRVSPGGFVIIDDYGLPLGCRRAVDEYRGRHDIHEELGWVNEQTVFWRRTA